MLQALNGRSTLRRGSQDEANATLYIPFSVRAVNAAGEAVGFLPPLEYARCPDPENHWTLQAEGESAGRSSFFVRGTLSAPLSLQQARDTLDTVCVVTGWSLHDYGSPGMRHIEVISKISTRYDTES